MASIEKQFPCLFHLLGGYFHQDWCVDDPNPEAVLRRYLNDAIPGQVPGIVNEIEELLGKNMSDEQLKQTLFNDFACYYDSTVDNTPQAAWLRWIQEWLRDH